MLHKSGQEPLIKQASGRGYSGCRELVLSDCAMHHTVSAATVLVMAQIYIALQAKKQQYMLGQKIVAGRFVGLMKEATL